MLGERRKDLNTTETMRHLSALGTGPALAVFCWLAAVGQPVEQRWLEAMTDLSDKTVSRALQKLAELQYAVETQTNRWMVAPARQGILGDIFAALAVPSAGNFPAGATAGELEPQGGAGNFPTREATEGPDGPTEQPSVGNFPALDPASPPETTAAGKFPTIQPHLNILKNESGKEGLTESVDPPETFRRSGGSGESKAAREFWRQFNLEGWATVAQADLFAQAEAAVGPEAMLDVVHWCAVHGISDLARLHAAAMTWRAKKTVAPGPAGSPGIQAYREQRDREKRDGQ